MSDQRQRWLVETAWLAEHLDAPDIVVVDASWHMPDSGRDARAEYLEAHIPGAVYFDIDEIANRESDQPHTLPSPAAFASAMRKMGIGDGMRIVVYEAGGPFSAPRVWWMFRIMGVDDVALLNGGLAKWRGEGRPVTDAVPNRPERHFTARFNATMVKDLADMRRLVDGGTRPIVDVRSPGRFTAAEPEPREGVRGGHMPGAVNLHYARFANPDGTLRSGDDLEQIFAEAGLSTDDPIVTTCGSGVTAAIPILALATLGHERAALYDGSWSEWGSAEDTPVEQG